MKNIQIFINSIIIILLATGCSTFYNDDLFSEYYDYGRSTVNVIYRIKHNEMNNIPFILNKQKVFEMKEKYGTEYVYKSKNGSNIKIFAVYKIFNKSDQFYYYILEDKNEKPVANIKLITNKKGNVIRAEVINGK